MTSISTTAPSSQAADWFKLGAIVTTTFVVCWALVIGYWHVTDHHPATGDLALALFILPLGLLLAFWGGHKAIAARAAAVSAAGVAKPVSSAPVAAAASTAPVLAIMAAALRSPYGASVDELASAIADNEARADLDQELVDDNGFPVMTARCDDACDEALQDEITEWLSGQDIKPVRFSEEQWRALTLATGVAGELASLAAADLMSSEGHPPMLQLRLMLPQDWTAEVRRAATMWLRHTVSQYGWPEAAIATPGLPEQGHHETPATILTQLLPAASPDSKPLLAIVIACASLIGQESVDRLEANSSLFTSSLGSGQFPGEGASGLLLTDLRQAESIDGADLVLLGPLYEGRRNTSDDDARRTDPALLLELVERICQASAIELRQIDMLVADTAHRSSRVLELMALTAPTIPQLDAADDVVRVGLGSGSCGAVPFMTTLALARHYALERSAPVLCVSNEDPYLRSAALVRPAT
jgi:hypothetical protein